MDIQDSTVRVWCKKITEQRHFNTAILGVILLNAIVIGLETYPGVYKAYFELLHITDQICLAIFVAEIGMKVIAKGGLRNFFQDRWDSFDFVIVFVALFPLGMNQVGIARIFRLLRVLRTVTFLPQLQLLIATLLRTLPSLGNIIILLSLLFYFYAAMGSVFFASAMPENFGNLGRSALTLFGIVTLEGWVEIMQQATTHYAYAWVYFLSFILLGTFIIINLFVAVVVSNLEQSFREQEAAKIAEGLSQVELLTKLQVLYSQQLAMSERFQNLYGASQLGAKGNGTAPTALNQLALAPELE